MLEGASRFDEHRSASSNAGDQAAAPSLRVKWLPYSEERDLLFDVHTHVGVDTGFVLRSWWPYAQTTQHLLDDMSRNGIDRAVCFPFTLPSSFDSIAFADVGSVNLIENRFPFDRENKCLLDEVDRIDAEDRLLPFAMFDPFRKQDEQIAAIESLATRICGLKTQTTVLQSPIKELLKRGRGLMNLAEKHDWPVVVHTAVAPSDSWAQVADCIEVAAAFPRVRFNLAHSLRFHRRLLEEASKLNNVWIDCSAHLIHCALEKDDSPAIAPKSDRVDADYSKPADVLRAIAAIVPDRYLWGSDAPFMSWVDDSIAHRFNYKAEADVLHQLPESLRQNMGEFAPRQWLGRIANLVRKQA